MYSKVRQNKGSWLVLISDIQESVLYILGQFTNTSPSVLAFCHIFLNVKKKCSMYVQQLSTVFKTIFKHSTVVLLTAFAYIPSMICHTVYCTVIYFAGLHHKNPELDYVMILYVMSLHHPVGVCGASIILGPC